MMRRRSSTEVQGRPGARRRPARTPPGLAAGAACRQLLDRHTGESQWALLKSPRTVSTRSLVIVNSRDSGLAHHSPRITDVELEGVGAVVTGAASGIGRALARALALDVGAVVVAADIDGAGAEATAEKIAARAIAGRMTGFAAGIDVTDEPAIVALIERVEESLGFLTLSHPEVAAYEQRRASDRQSWPAGMRRELLGTPSPGLNPPTGLGL